MIGDALSVDGPLKQLFLLPLPYLRDAPDSSGKGWFMRLEEGTSTGRYKAYPGVYSTSFAVQLLCRQQDPTTEGTRNAIGAGIDYLTAQFVDSQHMHAEDRPRCKQMQKFQEVGHHDFVLTLKLCAVLQAANAVAKVVPKHPDFAALLAKHRTVLDEVANRLKQTAIRATSGGRAELAWPWHSIDGGEVDPIPTCQVLLTLTDETLRSSDRWLSEYEQTVSYLQSVLKADSAALINRVAACQTLLEIQPRLGEDLVPRPARQRLVAELAAAMTDLPDLPWQEVMHFQVPSPAGGTLSHYKPWIWTFPKIEFALCFGRLSPKAGRAPEFKVAAKIVHNISSHNGKVIFLQSAPPTLLASLRAADFLSEFRQMFLSTTHGKVSFAKERALLSAIGFLDRHRSVPAVVLFSLLIAAILPCQSKVATSITGAQPVTNSLAILHESASKLMAVWPLWCVFLVALLLLEEGTLLQRLRAALIAFILTVVGLVVMLPTLK